MIKLLAGFLPPEDRMPDEPPSEERARLIDQLILQLVQSGRSTIFEIGNLVHREFHEQAIFIAERVFMLVDQRKLVRIDDHTFAIAPEFAA